MFQFWALWATKFLLDNSLQIYPQIFSPFGVSHQQFKSYCTISKYSKTELNYTCDVKLLGSIKQAQRFIWWDFFLSLHCLICITLLLPKSKILLLIPIKYLLTEGEHEESQELPIRLNYLSPNVFLKGQMTYTLGFVDQKVFVATTQFCICSMKAAVDNLWANEQGCVPIKLHVQKQAASLGYHYHRDQTLATKMCSMDQQYIDHWETYGNGSNTAPSQTYWVRIWISSRSITGSLAH